MAIKTAKELNSKTIVECKDLDVIEGDLNSPLWVMKLPNDEIRVVLSLKEYTNLMDMLKNALKENLDLKLEKAILSEFPIDYDDVKAVVLEEMKKSDKSIDEILQKVKLENPNLFYNLDIDKLL